MNMDNINNTNCLMSRFAPKGQGYPDTSRDFELPIIACSVKACPANNGSHCVMPSMIKIDVTGKCEAAAKYSKVTGA